MFTFIESEELDKNIDNEYINELESKMNIKFPQILRKYYLKHNFSKEKKCTFKIDGIDVYFVLDYIMPLKYGNTSVEKEYKYVLDNEYIPNNYIPFAVDMNSDNYYWDSENSKVYYISHENVENPILVCNNVDEFFEILNKSCNEEITIPNLNDNYNRKVIVSLDNKEKINVEKILKYNGKYILACTLVGITLSIISLFLIPFTDGLSVILVGVFGIWTFVFIVIDIINRIKTNISLKKYDINILKKELENSIKLAGIDTYLTNNYIISNSKTIKITKYSEIKWVFVENVTGTVSQKIIISLAYKLGGTPVMAYLNNGKKVVVSIIKSENNANILFSKIKQKNNKALIGNSLENISKYKIINPKHKKSYSNKIVSIIIIIILLITLIYGFFNK